MNFKTKILTSVLAVGLTVALVGGSTMAWFTDSKTVEGATFKAGTVTLKDSGNLTIGGFEEQNINPGDDFTADLTIVYTGSKPALLRVKVPDISWTPAAGKPSLNTDNVLLDALDDNWVQHGDYIYYKGVILGTEKDKDYPAAADEAARTVHFVLTGHFSGEDTTNDYQGATFNLGDSALEVIQATNGASNAAGWASLES